MATSAAASSTTTSTTSTTTESKSEVKAGVVTYASLLAEGKWNDLLNWAEAKEIEDGGVVKGDASFHQWIIQILTALLTDQMEVARFVWKRIPATEKKRSKELGAIWRIAQCFAKREPTAFFTSSTGYAWSAPVEPLVRALVERTRESNAALIAKAYSTVSLPTFATFMGLPIERAAAYALAQKWTIDSAKSPAVVSPVRPTVTKPSTTSVEQLRQLAEYVSYLERRT